MLNNFKNILTQIRKARERELAEYEDILGGRSGDYQIHELRVREAILRLELPFKTDIVSIMEARGSLYEEKDNKRSKKIKKTAHQVIDEWRNDSESRDTRQARRSFCHLLKGGGLLLYHHDHGSESEAVPAKDLPKILTRKSMLNFIDGLNIANSSKETFRGYANSLYEFLTKDLDLSQLMYAQENLLSLSDANKFFEFLECRALKSTTIRAFEDLFICRALTYIPLPAKRLFSLKAPDELNKCLNLEENKIMLPQSFIDLWKCFSIYDLLFPCKLNERLLHQKIRRLGDYAELSITLTPSILRSSLYSICYNNLYINSEVIHKLPIRE